MQGRKRRQTLQFGQQLFVNNGRFRMVRAAMHHTVCNGLHLHMRKALNQ